MLRYLSVTAITAGLLFSANPSAVACDWTHCPGTDIVCRQVSCDRPIIIGCQQPLGIVQICI